MSCSAMFVDELWDIVRDEVSDNHRRVVAQRLVRLFDAYNWHDREECRQILYDAGEE